MAYFYKCIICNLIPLNIKRCISCEAVICKECRHKILEEAHQRQVDSELQTAGEQDNEGSAHFRASETACCP